MIVARPKRFTLDEYHRLIDSGFFAENEGIELIRGEIIEKIAKGTAHSFCCTRLINELAKILSGQAILRCQDPILLSSNSEPEPDFAIARIRDDNYLSSHPTPQDVLLLIEIADSSINYDRTIKLSLYAEAGIEHYWIFNLPDRQLETYSHPYQKINDGCDYSQKLIFLSDRTVSLPNFYNLNLDLSKIFPS
jgi:Uma2 family endonuclease